MPLIAIGELSDCAALPAWHCGAAPATVTMSTRCCEPVQAPGFAKRARKEYGPAIVAAVQQALAFKDRLPPGDILPGVRRSLPAAHCCIPNSRHPDKPVQRRCITKEIHALQQPSLLDPCKPCAIAVPAGVLSFWGTAAKGLPRAEHSGNPAGARMRTAVSPDCCATPSLLDREAGLSVNHEMGVAGV